MTGNLLGEFLRARRAALEPQDVGMVSHGVRRVAGLRREEVADLAGVNADYYARLEQGRERHPSPQVLDALGRALRLAPDTHAHLHRLAGTPPADRPATDRISPALRQLLDGFSDAPAFVINATLDILAANPRAEALHSPFAPADNLARMVFLDPAGRHFYTDWTSTARATAAHLRQTSGITPDDPRLRSLVHTLTAHSPDFTRLWTTHDVLGKTQDTKHLHHPSVGPLTVTYQSFDVRAAPGQQLIVYQPVPDTLTAEALFRIATRTAGLLPGDAAEP
ncbi:helix-turn-helix transcriptional regulator [Streptomyces sp. NBC_01408]|uniref:helix-turn-helix transcriptional regulator n=1 Tax=Streptomyces sp. NBC_01408 TaxID=2903855 RepID=UPI00225061BA|nr:helix-turn-helix transcriptional regulator [Streptomyces sp. NBC_01408]MCX4695467.1 helix-turn-helix transcriptional regulator [Streptomyces sp. NBC_01408]